MIQLQYNLATNALRLELPAEWDAKLLSGLTVGAKDNDGNVLLAPAAATLYTATTLDGAVSRYADDIVLDSGADALNIGDSIVLSGPSGEEVRRVQSYVAATFTAKLESAVDHEYDDEDDVYGRFATYTLDTTTIATWTLALPFVLTWTPTGTGMPITQTARISKSALNLAGLYSRFKSKFPRAYKAFTIPVDKFEAMRDEAQTEVAAEALYDNLDIERIVDQDVIISTIMAKMAWFWCLQSDDDMETERQTLANEYEKKYSVMMKSAIWSDDNQDEKKDEDEVTDHEHYFENGW